MKRICKVILSSILSITILLVPMFINATSPEKQLPIDELNALPENSIERYAYSKALTNNTSFEDELNKEKDKTSIVSLAADEEIAYITKESQAGSIKTNIGVLTPYISTEARVVVNRQTGKVIRVEDFGYPHVNVYPHSANWSGGGFNINQTSQTSARISTTGQFIINKETIIVGFDIISVTENLGTKTKVMTLISNVGW